MGLIEPFILHCLTERGFAANSARNYRAVLNSATAWLEKKHKTLLDSDAKDWGGYLASLTKRGLKSSTIRLAWNCIQSFLGYATDVLDVDRKAVQLNLDPPQIGEPLPAVLNRHQVAALLEAPRSFDKTCLRDKALLEVLYACGLRISELVGLTVKDIDFRDRSLKVRGKGGKDRMVPVGHVALIALRKYLDDWRPKYNRRKIDALWLTIRGEALGKPAVRKLLAECCDRANIVQTVTPHTLRHCFATHLVAGGANLRVVQELMGHANLNTTAIYLHLDSSRLKKVHAKFHPRG